MAVQDAGPSAASGSRCRRAPTRQRRRTHPGQVLAQPLAVANPHPRKHANADCTAQSSPPACQCNQTTERSEPRSGAQESWLKHPMQMSWAWLSRRTTTPGAQRCGMPLQFRQAHRPAVCSATRQGDCPTRRHAGMAARRNQPHRLPPTPWLTPLLASLCAGAGRQGCTWPPPAGRPGRHQGKARAQQQGGHR